MAGKKSNPAPVFAALGDETRLAIVERLCGGETLSISQLSEGSKLTRQAITKHLKVLESAGIVHGLRSGRETLFEYDPQPLKGLKSYIENVSAQWDDTLGRLKDFVED